MSYGWFDRGRRVLGALLALGCGGAVSAGTVVINANTAYPGGSPPYYGDFRTTNGNITSASNWRYSGLAGGATVGINTTYADANGGNGSVYFHTTGTSSSKADVEYRPGNIFNPISIGGTLSQLTSFGYDWYRDSDSTNPANQAPALRLLVQSGITTRTLVFEPVYNGYSSIPTDTWVSSDAYNGGNAVLWATNAPSTYQSLSTFLSQYGSWNVVGFSFGVGSGWDGAFTGAVDNVRIGFNGADPTVYNFEVSGVPTVPEPSSVAMGLIAGAGGLAVAARRRRSK